MLIQLRSVAVSAIFLIAATPTLSAATIDVVVGPGGAFTYVPADVTISVGDTVRWTWESNNHNVGSGLPGAPTAAFLSGDPEPSGTIFEFVFDQAFLDANPVAGNVYDYHCHPHGFAGMVGTVAVATAVPTLPDWGLIAMALLLVTGAVVLGRRRGLVVHAS